MISGIFKKGKKAKTASKDLEDLFSRPVKEVKEEELPQEQEVPADLRQEGDE